MTGERRPRRYLSSMNGPTDSRFWDDLNRDLEDPEFRRVFIDECLRIIIEQGDVDEKTD